MTVAGDGKKGLLEKPDSIRAAYDRWSRQYDEQENATRDLDEQLLPQLAPPLDGRVVVEAGCGTGKNSRWLAPQVARLLGLDFSTGMLRLARSRVRAPHVAFVHADLTNVWPIAAASADVVLFNLVLEHVRSLGPVFQQAARVLRPGGQLYISEYHPARLALGSGATIPGEGGLVFGSYLNTEAEYLAALAGAGFTVGRKAELGEAPGKPPLLLTINASLSAR